MRIHSINTGTGRRTSVYSKRQSDGVYYVFDFATDAKLGAVAPFRSRWVLGTQTDRSLPFETLTEALTYVATQLAYQPEPVPVVEAPADTLDVAGTRFTRVDPEAGVWPGEFYHLHFVADKEVTADEISHMFKLIDYAWAATVAGERLSVTGDNGPDSFTVFADVTKSQRSDVGGAIADFMDLWPKMLTEGSPVRTTNRAGGGTKGTQKIVAFPKPITLTMYADNVWTDSNSPF